MTKTQMKLTLAGLASLLALILIGCTTADARPYVVTDWNNTIDIKGPAAPYYTAVRVANGTYATGEALASAIQTAMENQWDFNSGCSYNAGTPFGFTITWVHAWNPNHVYAFATNTGPHRSSAIWSLISFSTVADILEGDYGLDGHSTNVIPFGSVDTPAPNATVSGTILVQGWTLAQWPAAMTSIGITLIVDGISRGTVTYGGSRPDVLAAYPFFVNSAAAGWAIDFDTRALTNGQHTLYVLAYDDLGVGRGAGIGSRYITVAN